MVNDTGRDGSTKTNDLRNLGIFYVKSDISGGITRENYEEKTYNDKRVSRLEEGKGSAFLLVTFHGLGTGERERGGGGGGGGRRRRRRRGSITI
jgi:hypothetical protein